MSVRMTEDQFRLMFGQKPATARAPRVQRKREDLPENQLEQQVRDFLAVRGWIVTRNHVGLFVPYRILAEMREGKRPKAVPIRVNEKGTPDWLATRPIPGRRGVSEQFHFEAKGTRLPSPEQRLWMDRCNATGGLAIWARTFEAFAVQYARFFGDRAGDGPAEGATA